MLPKQFSDSICRVMSLPQALGEGRLKHAVESWAKTCVFILGAQGEAQWSLVSAFDGLWCGLAEGQPHS